jgi:hypothetical protein
MIEFLFGVSVGLFIGAFLWTALTLRESARREADNDERIRQRYQHPSNPDWEPEDPGPIRLVGGKQGPHHKA